jgi:hypothetical protein
MSRHTGRMRDGRARRREAELLARREPAAHQALDPHRLGPGPGRRTDDRTGDPQALGRALDQVRPDAWPAEIGLRDEPPLRVVRFRLPVVAHDRVVLLLAVVAHHGPVPLRAVIAHGGTERTPADHVAPAAPLDPRGAPVVIGYPRPVVVEPAPPPIVERQPAPVPVAGEGPAPIGPHPAPAGLVGCEIHAHDRGVRTPHEAVVVELDPLAVRVERGLDLGVGDRPDHVARGLGVGRRFDGPELAVGARCGRILRIPRVHASAGGALDDHGLGKHRAVVRVLMDAAGGEDDPGGQETVTGHGTGGCSVRAVAPQY